LSSLFEYPLNIWLKDSCSFLEQGLNGYSLFFCLWKFFTPGPGIVVFLYDRKEWHLLLQVCEILKDRYPILSYGLGCWIYLRLQQVDLAESFLTRLLEALGMVVELNECLSYLANLSRRRNAGFWN